MPAYKYPETFIVIFLFSLLTVPAFSQSKKEPFNIPSTDQKVSGSHYNEIHFIDARADTVKMGFVQVGMMNTQADIVFKEPIRDQLSTLIEELTDASAQKNTLYFQLRKFSFSEQTGTSSEMGVFRFRAGLYRKLNDQFIKLNYVDTVILMKAGAFGDVTKSLMQHAGTEIIQFVQVSLRQEGAISDAYSLTEIENPDSVEKSKIKLYTTTQYTDGLYRSYKAFAAQIPDQTMIVVEEKNNKIRSVKIADSSGKIILVKAREAYAIVYKGQPYVATSYDFYPLSRKKEDFYFTGKIKTGVDPVAGVMFGVMGSLLSNSYYTFEMKIDHISGGFIRIRYIPNPE